MIEICLFQVKSFELVHVDALNSIDLIVEEIKRMINSGSLCRFYACVRNNNFDA